MTSGLDKIFKQDTSFYAASVQLLGPIIAMIKSVEKTKQAMTLIEDNTQLSKKCDKNVCSPDWVNTCLVHNLKTIQENNQKIKDIDACLKKYDLVGGVSSIATSAALGGYAFITRAKSIKALPSIAACMYGYIGLKMLDNGLK